MASAAVSPDPSLQWLSPRSSFSADCGPPKAADAVAVPVQDTPNSPDFEFRLDDPVAILTADELFADGKLIPLIPAAPSPAPPLQTESADPEVPPPPAVAAQTSRWRDLLGMRRGGNHGSGGASSSKKLNPRPPIRYLLKRHQSLKPEPTTSHHNCKPESSLSTPLLVGDAVQDVSVEPAPPAGAAAPTSASGRAGPRRIRVLSHARDGTEGDPDPIKDSPRLNAAGKVVFTGLERSSSSPGSFTGGSRPQRLRGIERSHSATVRVAPVLNVPVCSLRGSGRRPVSVFGLEKLFGPNQRRERDAAAAGVIKTSKKSTKPEKERA